MIVGTVVISPCWPMEIAKASTISLPVKTMIKETADHPISLIGLNVPTIQNSLVMEHVTIISKSKLNAIMMVVTVVISHCWLMEIVMASTIFLPVTTMIRETADHQT